MWIGRPAGGRAAEVNKWLRAWADSLPGDGGRPTAAAAVGPDTAAVGPDAAAAASLRLMARLLVWTQSWPAAAAAAGAVGTAAEEAADAELCSMETDAAAVATAAAAGAEGAAVGAPTDAEVHDVSAGAAAAATAATAGVEDASVGEPAAETRRTGAQSFQPVTEVGGAGRGDGVDMCTRSSGGATAGATDLLGGHYRELGALIKRALECEHWARILRWVCG
jgi:hypothetical protein